MRFRVIIIATLAVAGYGNSGQVTSELLDPLADNFALRTAIVAETPRSVVIGYNTVSSSLAEATAMAQSRCQQRGRDAMLQTNQPTDDFLNDSQFACL
jgi:hypothetical protein